MTHRIFTRILACFIALTAVMTSIAPLPAASAATADATRYNVTLNFQLDDNIVMARYGVKVYLDEEDLYTMEQGDIMLKIRDVAPGIHTIRVVPLKKKPKELSFDIYVGTNTTVCATLKTHRKYVGMETMTISVPGQTISFVEGQESWTDFAEDLFVMTLMSCI